MPLRAPVAAAFVLMFYLAAPARVSGQLSHSRITASDIERGISIGRTVVDIARRSRSPARRSGSGVPPSTGGGVHRTSGSRTARLVIESGEEFVGVPYVWGGTSPAGFDCSGFVQYVFREHDVALPRTSRQMAHAGRPVSPHIADLAQGDLMLFYGRDHAVIDHVAIYAGNNRILHSSSSGHGVRYDDLSTKRGHYFVAHLVAARRVTENGRSLVDPLSWINRVAPFDHLDPPDDAPPAPRERF